MVETAYVQGGGSHHDVYQCISVSDCIIMWGDCIAGVLQGGRSVFTHYNSTRIDGLQEGSMDYNADNEGGTHCNASYGPTGVAMNGSHHDMYQCIVMQCQQDGFTL